MMMKNGKAGRKDEITAELLKADISTTGSIFKDIWVKTSSKNMETGTNCKNTKERKPCRLR